MGKKIVLTADSIKRAYAEYTNGESLKDVAARRGVNYNVLLRNLKENGYYPIHRRCLLPYKKLRSLYNKYKNGETIESLAQQSDVDPQILEDKFKSYESKKHEPTEADVSVTAVIVKSPPTVETRICECCGAEFQVSSLSHKKYCDLCVNKSKSRGKDRIADLNRAFTRDTPFLVWKWHSEGLSLASIARLLDRSEENVQLALSLAEEKYGPCVKKKKTKKK